MSDTYNIYCDESCHLEHDESPVMVLGAVWCPAVKSHDLAEHIGQIKRRHGLPRTFEIKWGKVSPAKTPFYMDIVDYFFAEEDVHFRALIVPDETKPTGGEVEFDHDSWYYRMYFDALKVLLDPDAFYRIYLDIKDTRGASRVRQLHDALCDEIGDVRHEVIERVEMVRSHDVELVQLADLLTGIVCYANRGIQGNAGKVALVDRMREMCGHNLTSKTSLREKKVNLFRWEAKGHQV